MRHAAFLVLAAAACSPLPVIEYPEQKLQFERSPGACARVDLRMHAATLRVVRGERARLSGAFRVRAPSQEEAVALALGGEPELKLADDGTWQIRGRCPPGCPLALADYELRLELPRGVHATLHVDEGLVVIDTALPVLEVVTRQARVVARLDGGVATFNAEAGDLRLIGQSDNLSVTTDSATVCTTLASVPGYRLFVTTESGVVDEQMRVGWGGPKPPPGVARIAEIGPGPPGAVRLTSRSGRIVLRELEDRVALPVGGGNGR